MIDYIHARLREWGDTRYYIDNGSASPTSIWGRMKEGWSIAAAEHSERPCPPEVMLGGALEMSIAIRKAIEARQFTERQFQVLYMHYAQRENTKRKIDALKLSKRRYYDLLNRSHRILRRYATCESELHNSERDKINGTDLIESAIPTRGEQYA